MIFNGKNETMPRDELEQLQVEKLQSTLNRVYRNVDFYKNSFDRHGVNIEKIDSTADLKHLPFTTREDLRGAYPYGMFAVPLRDVVRIHSSAGRTGKPIAIGYTRNDLKYWSEMVARILVAAGLTDHDFVQIAFDYSMFTGAFGLHYGAEKLGASVIPSSSSRRIQEQIHIMKDYKTSVLVSSPSYAFDIAHNMREMNIHPDELNLRIGIFGTEPWNEKRRQSIEELLHIDAYNTYGINTLVGPGAAAECEATEGLHVNEDHFIVEVIDPESGAVLPHGEEGELVFTTITREGFPLIRYRTGDISSIIEETCSCGRTFLRISQVSTRTDDMIVIKGLSIFPWQIEDILTRVQEKDPQYRVIVDNRDGVDSLEVQLEVSDTLFADEVKKLVELKSRIAGDILSELGITAQVTLVEPESIKKEGDAARVIDKR